MSKLVSWICAVLSVSILDFSRAESADMALAESALRSKNYQKVIDLLSPDVQSLDRNGLFLMAKAYSSLKNPQAAIKLYTSCLALDSKDVEAKTLIGAELFVQNKDKEAISALREALEINPKFAPAYKVMARIYEKKKNKYELRLLYQDMLDKVGPKAEYFSKLCELTTLDGLYDLALKYCQTGIQKNAMDPVNFVYLGITYSQTGERKKAENYLKKAADEFVDSEVAQISYAQFLDEKKDYANAVTYYQRAVDTNKRSTPALIGLGSASIEIQRYQDSLNAFLAACKIDRTAAPHFRKAISTLRALKNSEWLRKFEQGVDRCNGY